MAADKAARVYRARDCIYHPGNSSSASNVRVICFATQLSKMRLSISRGEKWIPRPSRLRAAETGARIWKKKKKTKYRARGCGVYYIRVYVYTIHSGAAPANLSDRG